MKRRVRTIALTLILLTSIGFAGASPAAAQDFPAKLSIGTNPIGSLFYAAGSALAKVLSDRVPVPVRVQPFAGQSVVLPMVNQGEVELGLNTTNESRMSFRGIEPFQPAPNIRLVSVMFPIQVAWFVRDSSGIRTMQQLKGKRLSGQYAAMVEVSFIAESLLKGASMDWGDVSMVPTASVVTGANDFIEGRVDATLFALGAAKVKEADAAVAGGIRFLSIDASEAGVKRMQDVMPGTYPVRVPGGVTTGILEDTWIQAYDVFLTTSDRMSDKAAGALVKALYEAQEEIKKSFPPFRGFARERMAKENATIPYHRGAVAAYKELGLWSATLDEHQSEMMRSAAR